MSKTKVLYQDGSILITEHAIIINNYYFPTGTPKIILWNTVRTVFAERLTLFNGKYRLWGMGLRPYWFNKDWRVRKTNMFVIDTGSFIKAVLTPDDFESAREAINTKIKVNSRTTEWGAE